MRKILATLAVLYGLLCGGMYLFQRDLLYPGAHHGGYRPPQESNLADRFDEVKLLTTDGVELTGWHAHGDGAHPTIVFMHGNADTMAGTASIAHPYIARGYAAFIVPYRGYDGQRGNPTEQGLYADARAAATWLKATGLRPGDMVLFGHSLGTGVATQLAAELKPRALVLFAPFTSTVDVAKRLYPFLPVSLLAKDRFDNAAKIARVGVPVFVAHGDADRTVPFAQGKALADMARQPKLFVPLPGAGHGDLFDDAVAPLTEWLASIE